MVAGGTAAAMPGASPAGAVYVQPPRVASNIKVLGVLWLVFAGLHLIPGLIVIVLFSGAANFIPDIPAFMPMLLVGFGVALSALSAIGLIAGWGLLSWKPWARMLSIVLGVISLLNFPLGTALGIYTLWVLMPAASEHEYQQAVAAVPSI